MLQIINKWKVTVSMANGDMHTFWVNDNFLPNVLRKVADLQFSATGLQEPTSISISIAVLEPLLSIAVGANAQD